MINLKRIWPYGLMALVVAVIDRLTKSYALTHCVERVTVNDFLSCRLVFNRGVSWSMFHSTNEYVFMMVSFCVVAITMFVVWHAYERFSKRACIAGETLIITGSLSNIIDRINYGGVIDFIELSYGDYHWAVFNVADAAIIVGIGIVLLLYYQGKE